MDQYLEEEIVITEDLQAGVADIDEHGRQFSCLKFPAGSPRESHHARFAASMHILF